MLKLSLSAILMAILFYGCGGNSNCCEGDLQNITKDVEKKGEPQSVKLLPTPLISYKEKECVKGGTISFDARGSADEDGHIIKYEWLLDGVVVASDPKPVFTCDEAGVRELCLRVTDDDNQTSSLVCQDYIIKAKSKIAPVAIINDLSPVCTEGETIYAKGDQSGDIDGEIMTFKWSFSDINSTKKDPVFVCPKEGRYEICLEVTDNDGLRDKECSFITAQSAPNNPPAAIIEPKEYSCTVGETIEINATKSNDSDGYITGYIWSLETLEGESGTFYCDKPGVETVCLGVVDDKNLSSPQVCANITIAKPANIPPVAKITITSDECVAGEKILADGTTSSDSDGNVTAYLWSEDENQSASTEKKPIFECKREGIKTICLTVTDNDGEKSTNYECRDITVKPKIIETIPPVTAMNIGENTGDGVWFDCNKSYDPDSVDSDNNAQNDGKIVEHQWIVKKFFKDGSSFEHNSPKCPKWIGTPDKLDYMEVNLTVTDDDGETTSLINIYDWNGKKLILRE